MSNPASSLDLIPVRDILPEQGPEEPAMIVTDSGAFLALLRLTGVSFHMKSPAEQAAILNGFGAFLNSLDDDAPIQLFMHKRRLDPDIYVRGYDSRQQDPNISPTMRALIEDHLRHFQSLAADRNLLQREDYLVLSFGADVEAVGDRIVDTMPFAGFVQRLMNANVTAGQSSAIDRGQMILARQQISLRCRQAIAYFEGIGVSVEPLRATEAEMLLFEIFNPGAAEKQASRAANAEMQLKILGAPESSRR